jgi:hypothetical protein
MTWKELFLVMATDDFRPHFNEDVTISVGGEYYKATLDVCHDHVLDDGNVFLKEETNE